MSNEKDFGYEFEGGSVKAYIDSDNDGIKSLEAELSIKELIEEITANGGKVEKKITFEMVGLTLVGQVDTDGDGEFVGSLKCNVAEAGDEILAKIKK